MKYIVCGIPPGSGGVGKLIEYLNEKVDQSKYVVLYPKTYNFKNRYIKTILNLISRIIFFRVKLKSVKNKKIILMHHQSIGLKATKFLIDNNKKIDFYIMDNAFFCLKSYNYLEGQNKECLDCLGGNFKSAIENKCKVFPYKHSVYSNIKFLEYLKKQYQKINFYTLSNSNATLIKKHFGNNVFVKAIYFLTNDLVEDQKNIKSQNFNKNGNAFDIVFHADDLEAKGFEYVQELAKELKQYTFYIPTKKKIKNTNNNIFTKYMRWETGLKDAVVNAKLVLTPSFWSNTPEAATLKSFLYNGSVGLVKNKYGFVNEIDHQAYLQLSGKKNVDVKIIDNFIKKKNYVHLSENGKKYIKKYFKEAHKLMEEFFKYK
tara:strand:+ start:2190 stop:3308 length:1119 start_codon:yes stop_codon:yes gene_type:complete